MASLAVIICAHHPPTLCGVGDHGAILAATLAKNGTPVLFLTRAGQDIPTDLSYDVVAAPSASWRDTLQHWSDALAPLSSAAVFLQYTPSLYGAPPLGTNPSLVRWWSSIEGFKALVAHEGHYPIEISPRGLAFGLPQRLQFLKLLEASNAAIFSFGALRAHFKACLGPSQNQRHVIPVGSNIPTCENLELRPIRGPAVLGFFGGHHPTIDVAALSGALLQCPDDTTLELIGPGAGTIADMLHRHFGIGEHRLIRTGVLPPIEVARHMSRWTLQLAPFVDGVSTRRGSVLAGLACGIPVATTRGISTDNTLPWQEFLALAPAGSCADFSGMVRVLLQSKALANLGERGLSYYQKYFSWSVIARKYMETIP